MASLGGDNISASPARNAPSTSQTRILLLRYLARAPTGLLSPAHAPVVNPPDAAGYTIPGEWVFVGRDETGTEYYYRRP